MINDPTTGKSKAGSYNPENGVYTYSDGTKVPTNAKIYSMQASGSTDDLGLGLTSTQVGKTKMNIASGRLIMDKIDNIRQDIEKNPTAIGGVGELIGHIRGVVGQVDNLIGTDFAAAIPEVMNVRGQFKQLRPMMVNYLEGIGRYNNATQAMIDDLFAGLEKTTSAEQTMIQLNNIYDQIEKERDSYLSLLKSTEEHTKDMPKNSLGAVIINDPAQFADIPIGALVVDSKGRTTVMTKKMKDKYK
jgi:hypothetical protein